VEVQTGTWHYGLIARWWAEFNLAAENEIAYYRQAIKRFGQPVLDLGCGTGRLLAPLIAEGFDVDGVDVSADMVDAASALVPRSRLFVQPLHELNLERTYRTAYMCGVLGIGGRPDHDRQALERVFAHLAPGGALLTVHRVPAQDAEEPDHTQPWPEAGDRKRCADGDEIELISRVGAFDPLEQVVVLEMRSRLWHEGRILKEESHSLRSCVYAARDVVSMLESAGFVDVVIEGNYTGAPATAEDADVIVVARRPS
jgi:SAM-dependent methyltransferase